MHIITDPTVILGEAFEVRSLCVHLVLWAANPHLLNASIHCFHSWHLDTQDPAAINSNNILRHWTQTNRYQAPIETTHNDNLSCKDDRLVAASPSFHFCSPTSCTDHSPDAIQAPADTQSPLRCSLSLLHAHRSNAQTPQIFHHSSTSPSITIVSREYIAAHPRHWRNGRNQQLAKQLQEQKQERKKHKIDYSECCLSLPILHYQIATTALQIFQPLSP